MSSLMLGSLLPTGYFPQAWRTGNYRQSCGCCAASPIAA
jgi:hypothetical protein